MSKTLKLLLALTLVLTQAFTPSESANTATKIGTIPLWVSGSRYDADMILVNYDTINTDLVLEAVADSRNSVCAAGMFLSSPNSQVVSFKLDSSNYLAMNLISNQGIFDKLQSGVSICSVPGNSLTLKSTGTISSMLLYIVQASSLKFGGR